MDHRIGKIHIVDNRAGHDRDERRFQLETDSLLQEPFGDSGNGAETEKTAARESDPVHITADGGGTERVGMDGSRVRSAHGNAGRRAAGRQNGGRPPVDSLVRVMPDGDAGHICQRIEWSRFEPNNSRRIMRGHGKEPFVDR